MGPYFHHKRMTDITVPLVGDDPTLPVSGGYANDHQEKARWTPRDEYQDDGTQWCGRICVLNVEPRKEYTLEYIMIPVPYIL